MSRPFRIWNPQTRQEQRYHYYETERSAKSHILVWLWYEGNLGDSFEIVNNVTWSHLGTFTKAVDGLVYLPANLERSKEYGRTQRESAKDASIKKATQSRKGTTSDADSKRRDPSQTRQINQTIFRSRRGKASKK